MPFVTAGYPSLQTTAAVIPALEQAGAHIVELGIPFSDPIADGPVIAASMHEALLSGVTPRAVFDVVREIRSQTKLGLLAMVSNSIVHRMGAARFVAEAANAGFDGLIVPDIDIDSAEAVGGLTRDHGMSLSLLIAPTTPEDRIGRITSLCSGFVYLLARVGITGEQEAAPDIADRVRIVRQHTDLPIAVGFGISRPEHVAAVTAYADAAIVGSALVRRLGNAKDPVQEAVSFIRPLAENLMTRPGRRVTDG